MAFGPLVFLSSSPVVQASFLSTICWQGVGHVASSVAKHVQTSASRSPAPGQHHLHRHWMRTVGPMHPEVYFFGKTKDSCCPFFDEALTAPPTATEKLHDSAAGRLLVHSVPSAFPWQYSPLR